MKRALVHLLVLVFAIALMPANTYSQQVNDKQAEQALRQKAYSLLESLAGESGSLQSDENRARMGSNIAESLWAHNETKAREIFASVIREIKAGLQDNDKDPDRGRTRPVFLKLREDTALRIGKHDPEMALAFLKESKPLTIKLDNKTEATLYLLLATQSAASNPDLALKLGRESLQVDLLDPQLFLLYDLTKKSPDHASIFFKELVKSVRQQYIGIDGQPQQFALMLARLFNPLPADESSFRDLMTYFTDVAVKNDCGMKKQKTNDASYFCYRLGLIIPLMEKVNPKRVAPMKHLARRASIYDWNPELGKYAEVYQNGSVDDLLAMIPEYPEFREFGQSVVIRKIQESGDFERARKLTNEFTWEEPSSKQEVLKQLDHNQRVATEDTSAELFREANELPNESEKFNYFFRKATEIGSTNRTTTTKLLDRANEILDTFPPEKWQMQYQIGIAMRYCQVKSDRCFTMIEPIIRRMNELVSAAIKLDGFDNRYLRNGE